MKINCFLKKNIELVPNYEPGLEGLQLIIKGANNSKKTVYLDYNNLNEFLKKYDTDEIIAVFRSDYFGRALQKPAEKQQEKEQFFKKAIHIFKNIKTCEMPNFAELQHDKDFPEKLKEYKIRTLINKLTIS